MKKQIPDLTHFLSLPILDNKIKLLLRNLQKASLTHLDQKLHSFLTLNNPNLFHLTLCMLNLRETSKKETILKIFNENLEEMNKIIKNQRLSLNFNKITCFSEDSKNYRKMKFLIKSMKFLIF